MKNSDFNYKKSTLENFLKALGSSSPVPGGGPAAALTGALGAALVEMVIRINAKRADKNAKAAAAMAAAQRTFLKLMGDDARAFDRASRLKKLGQLNRNYEKAVQQATLIPFKICEISAQALVIALAEKAQTSRWLMSDLKESAILLKAAFESAKLNVEINLKITNDFSDRTSLEKMRRTLEALEPDVERCYRGLIES